MIDFDHFVKDLGPEARHYSQDELQRLYAEVRKLAEVLLSTYHAQKPKQHMQQMKLHSTAPLDVQTDDHILESNLTERVDGDQTSRGP